jgi:hypothetical protein
MIDKRSDDFRWIPRRDRAGWNRSRDHTAGADNRTLAYFDPSKDDGIRPYPATASQDHRLGREPLVDYKFFMRVKLMIRDVYVDTCAKQHIVFYGDPSSARIWVGK